MINNKKELLSYIITGILTTAINYGIFFILVRLHFHWMVANTLAWAGAVMFAYAINRKYVFESERIDKGKELIEFIGLRFITLFIENILLYLCIRVIDFNIDFSKITVSILTVIGNYAFCKLFIFRKKS